MNKHFYIIKQGEITINFPKARSISPGKALDMLLEDPELILYGFMKDCPEDVWQYKSCPNKSIVFKSANDPWCACLMGLFVLDVFYTEEQFKYYHQFSL